MKKLISIDNLDVDMFVDADVVEEERDDQAQTLLEARGALKLGPTSKRARLNTRMARRVKEEGGLRIRGANIIDALRQTGLKMLTIDTQKGKDVGPGVQPMTDPKRRPPPAGRLVHFDEEIARAKEARDTANETLKETLADIAEGKGVDAERVAEASGVITESIMRNMDAMVSLTRIKKHDAYTAMHSMNVCTLVVAMAQQEGLEPDVLNTIATAALLHDVGKTRVPLEILNKPGRFEPEELQEMRKHATYSGDILREAGGFSDEAIAIATQHHEMLNGSGYPEGLAETSIHPFARMTAVADVYDALTAKRVYKPGMPMHKALLILLKNQGTEFDEHAVGLLVKTLGYYPVGSLVGLNTGETALVSEPNPENPRKPTVGIITMPNGKQRPAPMVINLARRSESADREIAKVFDPDKLNLNVEEIMRDIDERGERSDRRMR